LKNKRQSGHAPEGPKRKKKARKPEEGSWQEFLEGAFREPFESNEDFSSFFEGIKPEDFAGLDLDEEDVRGCFCGGSPNVCKDQSNPDDYKYGFTNSDFIYCISTLDPIEFIVLVTVFAIIFNAQFNLEELFVVNRFIGSLRDGIDILLNQRINHRLVCDIFRAQNADDAVQKQLEELQKNYDALNQQLQSMQKNGNPADIPVAEAALAGLGQAEVSLAEDIAEDNLFNSI